MMTASFQSKTILNEELVATVDCCYLNEGSDKQKRESECALMTGVIFPSTEPDVHVWILVRGGPLETAILNEFLTNNDKKRKTCCNSMRADA